MVTKEDLFFALTKFYYFADNGNTKETILAGILRTDDNFEEETVNEIVQELLDKGLIIPDKFSQENSFYDAYYLTEKGASIVRRAIELIP